MYAYIQIHSCLVLSLLKYVCVMWNPHTASDKATPESSKTSSTVGMWESLVSFMYIDGVGLKMFTYIGPPFHYIEMHLLCITTSYIQFFRLLHFQYMLYSIFIVLPQLAIYFCKHCIFMEHYAICYIDPQSAKFC